jgi:hypothetical protein
VRSSDEALLDQRATARTEYDAVVDEAAGWSLPRPIRDAMRAWQFDTATGLLDEAAAVLEQRDTIEAAAADAGLTPPDTLRTTFEDDDGFGDAQTEIDQQRNVIDHYADAVDTQPKDPDVFTQLGLWDATPERNLEAAKKAYTAGDLEGAVTDADDARMTWIGAASVGRTRAALIAAVVIGILLLLGVAAFALVRLRRNRRQRALAVASAGVAPVAPVPPASTPATDPDPTELVHRVDPTSPEQPG